MPKAAIDTKLQERIICALQGYCSKYGAADAHKLFDHRGAPHKLHECTEEQLNAVLLDAEALRRPWLETANA